jgi:hypothetical protein
MFEYLAQAQSAVRRINDRVATISKNLGNDSVVVGNIASKLEVMFPQNVRYKDGVPQIYQPSELFKDSYQNEDLEYLDKTLNTWSQIKKSYSQSYVEYVKQRMSEYKVPEPLTSFIKVQEQIPLALTYMYSVKNEETDRAIAIMKNPEYMKDEKDQVKRRKTYEELRGVLKLAKEGYKKGYKKQVGENVSSRYGRRWEPRKISIRR